MLSEYNVQINNHQNSVLLLYLIIYRLLVCANPARNVGKRKKEDNSSICCSMQYMYMHNSTTVLSKKISLFLAIVIWLVDHKPENSSKYCHSINTSIVHLGRIAVFVDFAFTNSNNPPYHIIAMERRTVFFAFPEMWVWNNVETTFSMSLWSKDKIIALINTL